MSKSAQEAQSEPGNVPPETKSVHSGLNWASIDRNDGSFNSDNNNPNRILCYTGMLKLNHIEDVSDSGCNCNKLKHVLHGVKVL